MKYDIVPYCSECVAGTYRNGQNTNNLINWEPKTMIEREFIHSNKDKSIVF